MRENWRLVLPGLGIAFGAAGGFIAFLAGTSILFTAYGASLGLVVGAITALLPKRAAGR